MGLTRDRARTALALAACPELSSYRRGNLMSHLAALSDSQLLSLGIEDCACNDEIAGFLDSEERRSVGEQHKLTPSEVEEACLRAMKKSKGSEVAISDFGATQWNFMSAAAGLSERPAIQLSVSNTGTTPKPDAFSWTDQPEGSQSDRYMQFLERIIPVPGRTSEPLVWLEGGSRCKNLLSVAGKAQVLHYEQISGNTDAAIITRASDRCLAYRTGLCILYELKKPENITPAALCQAACQLVLANMLSTSLQPVVVLTDLNDFWELLWMDGHEVCYGNFNSRSDAVAAINDLVHLAAQLATSIPSSSASPEMTAPRTPAHLPLVVATRKAAANLVARECGVAHLADLEGMLPEEEWVEALAAALAQQVQQLPSFCGLQSKAPPFSMYS